MAEREHVRPLAPASSERRREGVSSDDDEETATQVIINKEFRRKRCIKCCGAILAFLLIEAVVVVILIFTVFKIKDPIIKLNGVKVNGLDLVDATTTTTTNPPTPGPGSNIMTLTADVSVKNPNYASFKYKNTTTTLYYYGTVIGEARSPAGKAKARRTMRMNITVDIITDRLISHPMLTTEMASGLITMNSYTIVGGKVKMIKLINKHVTVKMNCTVSVNTTTRSIQDQKCKKKVKL